MLPTKHIQPFNRARRPAERQIPTAPVIHRPVKQTRRSVLARMAALIAIGAAGTTLPSFGARAAKKSSQKLVKYRDTPKGKRKCSGCTFYLPDEKACKVVEGTIDRNGWCLRWSKKRG